MQGLTEAIEAYKPEIAARFKALVQGQFNRMVEDLGPELKGVANSWTWARTWNGTVRPYVRKVGADLSGRGGVYQIEQGRLDAGAAEYADAVAAEWEAKIRGKLGELEGAGVARMDGCRFLVSGRKLGRAVRIEQGMILNVSSKGTLFNQFPARIYVDGKFTPETKFKALTA